MKLPTLRGRRRTPQEALRAKAMLAQEREDRRDDHGEVVAAVNEYTKLLEEAERESQLPAPSGPELVCARHGYYNPRPGQPPPPAHTCPDCKHEAVAKYARAGEGSSIEKDMWGRHVEVDLHPATNRMHEAWEQHQEKQRAEGKILPGSAEEQDALEYMELSREQRELRERRRPGGRKPDYVNAISGDVFYAQRDPRDVWGRGKRAALPPFESWMRNHKMHRRLAS